MCNNCFLICVAIKNLTDRNTPFIIIVERENENLDRRLPNGYDCYSCGSSKG